MDVDKAFQEWSSEREISKSKSGVSKCDPAMVKVIEGMVS